MCLGLKAGRRGWDAGLLRSVQMGPAVAPPRVSLHRCPAPREHRGRGRRKGKAALSPPPRFRERMDSSAPRGPDLGAAGEESIPPAGEAPSPRPEEPIAAPRDPKGDPGAGVHSPPTFPPGPYPATGTHCGVVCPPGCDLDVTATLFFHTIDRMLNSGGK